MKLADKFVYVLIFWSAIAQITQADTMNELCPSPPKAQRCTSVNFESGLPNEYYQETLRSVANLVIEDFIFYLTQSHGPFSDGKSPTIDYSVSFFSSSLETKNHGNVVFVVVSSPTSIKPFGINAVMSDGSISRIDISFGYSEYALLEEKIISFSVQRSFFGRSAINKNSVILACHGSDASCPNGYPFYMVSSVAC